MGSIGRGFSLSGDLSSPSFLDHKPSTLNLLEDADSSDRSREGLVGAIRIASKFLNASMEVRSRTSYSLDSRHQAPTRTSAVATLPHKKWKRQWKLLYC